MAYNFVQTARIGTVDSVGSSIVKEGLGEFYDFSSFPYHIKADARLEGNYILSKTVSINDVSRPESFQGATYASNTWDMEKVWYIKEGSERPRLVYRVLADLGDPLTHNMNYFYVVPHVQGTMNYLGLTWKSRGAFFSFPSPPASGVLGQEVTYSIPESAMQQRITNERDGVIDVTWFASGVRDVDGAGGFGSYNDQTTRTITIGNIASATVNFYFTQKKYIPTTNYKASVSTPDGIVDLLIKSPNVSDVIFTVEPGFNLGLILVPVDDDTATQIRIATADGIKALKMYNNDIDIEMEED